MRVVITRRCTKSHVTHPTHTMAEDRRADGRGPAARRQTRAARQRDSLNAVSRCAPAASIQCTGGAAGRRAAPRQKHPELTPWARPAVNYLLLHTTKLYTVAREMKQLKNKDAQLTAARHLHETKAFVAMPRDTAGYKEPPESPTIAEPPNIMHMPMAETK